MEEYGMEFIAGFTAGGFPYGVFRGEGEAFGEETVDDSLTSAGQTDVSKFEDDFPFEDTLPFEDDFSFADDLPF